MKQVQLALIGIGQVEGIDPITEVLNRAGIPIALNRNGLPGERQSNISGGYPPQPKCDR